MSALRVALMGYGAVADIHARSIIGCPEVEVVAVIGPRPGRAREFAERHGIPGVFDGLTEAHRAVHPDAVIITTPTGLHPRHARDAVNAGLHALVEFPLAAEPETTRKLFGEAEVRGLTLAVAHTSRFIWSFRRARSLLNEGAMGEVKAANFVRLMDRPPGRGAAGMSRTWTDDALVHHAGHVLDIYRFWFGDSVGLVGSVSPEGEQGRRNAGLLLEGPGWWWGTVGAGASGVAQPSRPHSPSPASVVGWRLMAWAPGARWLRRAGGCWPAHWLRRR